MIVGWLAEEVILTNIQIVTIHQQGIPTQQVQNRMG